MTKESLNPQFEASSHEDQLESSMTFREDKDNIAIKERSPQEIQELKDKLSFVARSLSKNFNLKFIPGKGWAAGLSEKFEKERRKHPNKNLEEFDEKLLTPEVMTYPENDLLERGEDYIFGVFRHEIGHIKHSDYQSLLEFQENAKKEGYKPLDLFVIYNAWEDGRSNTLEGKSSKAARFRIGTYLKEDVAEALMHEFESKPLPIQYGALCWARGAESFIDDFDFEAMKSKIKDKKVLKAYEETEKYLNKYLEESKGRKAFKDILWGKGWPIFKELIDKYIEDEAKKNYDESQSGSEQSNDQSQETQSQKSENQKGDEKQTEKGEPQSSEQKSDESKSSEEESKEVGEGESKSWNELSEQEKEQYINQAREKLSQEEREFVKQLQPKSIETKEKEDGSIEINPQTINPKDVEKSESQEEEFKQKEKEQKQQIQQAKDEVVKDIKKSLETLKERETGLTKEDRELYGEYFSSVKKHINILVERLDEVFPSQEEAEWGSGHRRGKRIDVRKIAREIPTERGRFFKKKEVPEIKEAAFSLLVDVSGSMRGENIKEALRAAVLMAEAFSKKGVPFEILAFHAKLFELKKFDEDYFGKKKMKLMDLLNEVSRNGSEDNDDGFAVEWAARRLQKRFLENDANGALIVFSDGEPDPIQEHRGPEWELHDIVDKWSKKIPLIGVGIGSGMEKTIKEYYGRNGLPVPDVSKLPRELLNILKKQLARFEQRNR
ncbi:MAG: VWA domain-containing protein [Patescibacteria group bacterium]